MASILMFFSTMLTALAVENTMFTRGLGFNRWVDRRESPIDLLWYGGAFTWTAFWVTLLNLVGIRLLENVGIARFLRTPFFLLSTIVVYIGTSYLVHHYLQEKSKWIRSFLPITTFNTALFSVFYTVFNRVQGGSFGIGRSVAYALGTGLGYTLALIIIMYAKKRIALSPVPKSLKGYPILLIYIGILSMALYGLLGFGSGI